MCNKQACMLQSEAVTTKRIKRHIFLSKKRSRVARLFIYKGFIQVTRVCVPVSKPYGGFFCVGCFCFAFCCSQKFSEKLGGVFLIGAPDTHTPAASLQSVPVDEPALNATCCQMSVRCGT